MPLQIVDNERDFSEKTENGGMATCLTRLINNLRVITSVHTAVIHEHLLPPPPLLFFPGNIIRVGFTGFNVFFMSANIKSRTLKRGAFYSGPRWKRNVLAFVLIARRHLQSRTLFETNLSSYRQVFPVRSLSIDTVFKKKHNLDLSLLRLID